MNENHNPIDEDSFFSIKSTPKYRQLFAAKLEDFASIRSGIDSVFENNTDIAIEHDLEHDQITFTYANVRIRLKLLVGISGDAIRGRVICTHEYQRLRKDEAYFLGEFLLDERGVTNLVDSNGNRLKSKLHADLIVSHYLAKALQHNMDI